MSDAARRAPLFADLSDAQWAALESVSMYEAHDGNQVIIREGDPGDALYVMVEGSVAVTKQVEGERIELLQVLAPGSYFGEMALLNVAPRSATVTTIEPTRVLKLSHEAFQAYVQQQPNTGALIYRAFAMTLSDRLRSTTEKLSEIVAQGETTTDETGRRMVGDEPVPYPGLQTPATLVKGIADLLSNGLVSTDRQQYFLRVMQEQARQLVQVLEGDAS